MCPLVIDGSTELPPRPTMRTGGVPGYQARPAVLGICGEPIKGGRPLAGDYCTAFHMFWVPIKGGVAQEASGSACAYLIAPRRSLSGAADSNATALDGMRSQNPPWTNWLQVHSDHSEPCEEGGGVALSRQMVRAWHSLAGLCAPPPSAGSSHWSVLIRKRTPTSGSTNTMDFRSGWLESFSLLSMCSSPVARARPAPPRSDGAMAGARACQAGGRAPVARVVLTRDWFLIWQEWAPIRPSKFGKSGPRSSVQVGARHGARVGEPGVSVPVGGAPPE